VLNAILKDIPQEMLGVTLPIKDIPQEMRDVTFSIFVKLSDNSDYITLIDNASLGFENNG